MQTKLPVLPFDAVLFTLFGLCPLPALEAGLGLSGGLYVARLEAGRHLTP